SGYVTETLRVAVTSSSSMGVGIWAGSLINCGTAAFTGNVTVGNGIENDGFINVATQTITANGSGWDNFGTLTLSGGTLSGNVLNDFGGAFSGFGTIATGLTNRNLVTVSVGKTITANGTGLVNNATLTLAGGTLAGS